MTTTTTTTLPLATGRGAVDPAHSSVGFTVRHLGISKVRGRFARFDADVVIGPSLDDTSIEATIDLASVDTANPDRDAHVSSPDFLDVERRPTMTFRSRSIEADGDGYRLVGDVLFGDTTTPMTMTVELGGLEIGPDGRRHAGFEATGELRRTDLGVAPGIPSAALGDVVKFQLDIQLLEPESE